MGVLGLAPSELAANVEAVLVVVAAAAAVVDTHVWSLRRKIELNPAEPRCLRRSMVRLGSGEAVGLMNLWGRYGNKLEENRPAHLIRSKIFLLTSSKPKMTSERMKILFLKHPPENRDPWVRDALEAIGAGTK